MKRVLTSLGIGAATVDTVLPTTLTAGESVDARVDVTGGNDSQEVDGIYFALETRYETDDSTGTAKIDTFRLADPFTIEPDEERSFTVSVDVPYHTPVTLGKTKVWLDTGLDIDWAVDPDDRDPSRSSPIRSGRRCSTPSSRLALRFDRPSARPRSRCSPTIASSRNSSSSPDRVRSRANWTNSRSSRSPRATASTCCSRSIAVVACWRNTSTPTSDTIGSRFDPATRAISSGSCER